MRYSSSAARYSGSGPLRSDHVRESDRSELSDGHAIYCAPAGAEHASKSVVAALIGADPAVKWAGIDAGYSPSPGMLRAPDVAIDVVREGRGWIKGVPPLAIEISAEGQDERDLEQKIAELLAHGTRWVWVVHLLGPRRVEVHELSKAVRVVGVSGELTAPGVLQNPVPVAAFYERDTAHEMTLRNLLQRRGFDSLEAVWSQAEARGEAKGLAEAVLTILTERAIPLSDDARTTILACTQPTTLRRWITRAVRVQTSTDLFAD